MNPTPKPQSKVTCGECHHFKRDTEGISRCRDTGEYFMGECLKGLRPDTEIKQFANKPRICKFYISKP